MIWLTALKLKQKQHMVLWCTMQCMHNARERTNERTKPLDNEEEYSRSSCENEKWYDIIYPIHPSTHPYRTYLYVGTGCPWAIHGRVVCPFNTTCLNECFSTLILGWTMPFGSVTIIRPGYVDICISPGTKKHVHNIT